MIQLKTSRQIEGIRAAAKVVVAAHQKVRARLKPGMSTYQVDNIVRHTLRDHGAKSAFWKYRQGNKPPFPAYACISVNEEVVHGIRRYNRILQEGDVITVDVGAHLGGYFGDAAFTTIIGGGTEEAQRLVRDTENALHMAIRMTKEGVLLHDICEAIYNYGTEKGYGVVTDYFGHGVGLKLHEPPQIPNFRPVPGNVQFGVNIKLQAGMTITYEPMFTLGSGKTEELSDQWTVVTKDRSLAAHAEHTILVTKTGAEILTI
jgi:methionyl aminopeptidase